MRAAISMVMASCLFVGGCGKDDSSESVASNAPPCSAADTVLLKTEAVSENVGMQEAFQAALQSLPDNVRESAVNRINAKVTSDGARMRVAEGGPRQWIALLLLSTKTEARAVPEFRYCNGDFDFGNGQRWRWVYSMSNGADGPELRINSAKMESGGVPTGATDGGQAQLVEVSVTGVDIGNALGADQRVAHPLSVLSSDDTTIYAAVVTNTSNPAVSVAAKLTAKWTLVDSGQVLFEDSRDAAFTGPGVTVFSIRRPDGWSAGSYQVEIGLNDAVVQTRQFQVQAGGDVPDTTDEGDATADAATAAADAAAAAADAYEGGAYRADAAARERARIAEESRQLERERRELARQRDQMAAQRASAQAEAEREQERAWREQQEATRRGPTADELYESRRRECPGGFLGSDCRKQIREQVCAGHWSPNPEPGYSNCKR